MSAPVSNEVLLNRTYFAANSATDDLNVLRAALDAGACVTSAELLPGLKTIRNNLRAALCAVQELKTRAKKLNRKSATEAQRHREA